MSLLYSKAAEILKQVCEGGKGFRDVFYSTDTGSAKTKLYALVSKTLALRPKLEEALQTVFPDEKFENLYFTLAMTCDIVHGREISGGGKIKRLLEKSKSKLKSLLKPAVKKVVATSSGPEHRFIRVIGDPKAIEREIVDILNISTAKTSHEAPASITIPIFKSTEFPEVFELTDPTLVGRMMRSETIRSSILKNRAFFQDKSTCITAHVLLDKLPTNPVHVLDVCAAPGSKSLHILSRLRLGDQLTLVEKSEKRAEVLKKRLMEATGWNGQDHGIIPADSPFGSGVKLRLITADFQTVNLPSVTHISLDPSCSGSGMETHAEGSSDAARLFNLAELQKRLLRHALKSFPKVQSVCYSTCSENREENEGVVESLVGTACARNFQVSDEFAKYLSVFKDGKCLKTSQAKSKCRGFFLAKLVRVEEKKGSVVVLAGNTKVKKVNPKMMGKGDD